MADKPKGPDAKRLPAATSSKEKTAKAAEEVVKKFDEELKKLPPALPPSADAAPSNETEKIDIKKLTDILKKVPKI